MEAATWGLGFRVLGSGALGLGPFQLWGFRVAGT